MPIESGSLKNGEFEWPAAEPSHLRSACMKLVEPSVIKELVMLLCIKRALFFRLNCFFFGSIHPRLHFLLKNNPFPIRKFRSAPSETAHKPFEGLF